MVEAAAAAAAAAAVEMQQKLSPRPPRKDSSGPVTSARSDRGLELTLERLVQ
jgi:hypothetical protein